MPTRMIALRSGNLGDGSTKVRRGREFTVEKDARVKDLENRNLARRADAPVKMDAETELQNKMETTLQNKASEEGPLPSAGGETGGEEAASSSGAGRQRAGRTSQRSRDRSE